MNSSNVAFVDIIDFTEDAKYVHCSESVYDLLGYEPHELLGTSSWLLVHSDELSKIKKLRHKIISQNQAAFLVYHQMKHKDPRKGYILCVISHTVCQSTMARIVSLAAPGHKAMHKASTAQGLEIITPAAKVFEFRRWNDTKPMAPCHPPSSSSPIPDRLDSSTTITFDPLPEQSVRTALILDRFTINCNILYCSNDSLISTTACMGRSFFDFIARKHEDHVRSCIDFIKFWGVNEHGHPSDGGFGFAKFNLLVRGRNSSAEQGLDRALSRHRNAVCDNPRGSTREGDGASISYRSPASSGYRNHENQADGQEPGTGDERVVDVIFSAHSDGLMVVLQPSAF